MTGDETGRQFVYDAWNRLVIVKNSSGTTLETFKYDGLNRRVSSDDGTTVTDLSYSSEWQVLSEKVGSNYTKRYVWSPVYVDAMILRDCDTDSNGTLDERLWVQQDANWNVTALVNSSGNVVERYAYDPYGVRTVYDASYTVRSGGSSYDFQHGFQGMWFDVVAGLNFTHTRPYSSSLGRFTGPDWIRFDGGNVNLYGFVGNSPLGLLDPTGLVDFDPSKLKPNWGDKTGLLYHHIDQVEITMKNCKAKKELQAVADDIFKNMTQFRDFNHPDNFASVRVFKDGYAGFKANGFAGWLARRISGDGPENLNFVKLKTGKQGPAKIPGQSHLNRGRIAVFLS